MTDEQQAARRQLHVFGGKPDEGEDGNKQKRNITPQMEASLMFWDGATIAGIALKLGMSAPEAEELIRRQFTAIVKQTEQLLAGIKQAAHEYHHEHKQLSEPELAGALNEKERLYREAKSDIYFDVAQNLQLAIDSGWHARLEKG